MQPRLIIEKSININAGPGSVWNVLVNPQKISEYFTGAETITNWLIGSPIVFIHHYNGEVFKNKGVILNYDENHLLQYTYWTAFSETEDKPENYTTITYTLTIIENATKLTFNQTNFKDEGWYKSLQTGWDTVLAKIKKLAEENPQ